MPEALARRAASLTGSGWSCTPSDYSNRSAVTGSTRMALRSGTALAAIATSISAAGANVNAAKSSPWTPATTLVRIP